jgi:hypothetical protein
MSGDQETESSVRETPFLKLSAKGSLESEMPTSVKRQGVSSKACLRHAVINFMAYKDSHDVWVEDFPEYLPKTGSIQELESLWYNFAKCEGMRMKMSSSDGNGQWKLLHDCRK